MKWSVLGGRATYNKQSVVPPGQLVVGEPARGARLRGGGARAPAPGGALVRGAARRGAARRALSLAAWWVTQFLYNVCRINLFLSIHPMEHRDDIFRDLSRAFDCVSRKILLRKLERYGVRAMELSIIESY